MEESGKNGTAFSILDPRERKQEKKEIPAYFQDLNLETVLDLLAFYGGKAVRELYRDLPRTPEDTAYRRAVYGDVKKEAVEDALTDFVKRLADAEDLRREKDKVPAGADVAVGVYVKCQGAGNGAWGKIDDAMLNSVR